MTFGEWSFHKFGISKITEGKAVCYKFLPINQNPFLANCHQLLIGAYGAVAKYNQGHFIGYSLPKPACDAFAHNMHLPSYGIKLYEEEYNFQAPVLIKVVNSKKADFLARFKTYDAVEVFDPLSKESRIRLNPQVLEALFHSYYSEQPPRQSVAQLTSEMDTFQLMQHQIMANNLSSYLDKARTLSLDYSNSSKVNCTLYEASSAYGMSLKIFAERHKGALSNQQYMVLMHAVEMLAGYDKANNIQQGLKSDSNFVDYITARLVQNKVKSDRSYKLISELPNGKYISQLIIDNAHDLLHGKKNASLGKNKTFIMRRFLPDASMKSEIPETNEIVLQAGGMITHSIMVRLVKVGMLNNGTQAPKGVKPHYFNYFKVETNLGAGCHNAEWRNKTCTGTYITQLYPTKNDHGTIVQSSVNPIQNPIEYQRQMEHTLTELIQTERELCFYRQPQSGPNGEDSSPPHSAEAHEWLRLNAKRDVLNGIPVSRRVNFLSINSNEEEIPAWIENQTGYMQEGGSCSIFSLKQLVASIVGDELCSLHSQFLQTHNGAQHLQVISNEIAERVWKIGDAAQKAGQLVKNYIDSINAYSLALQNLGILSRNAKEVTLYSHVSLVELVKDFPHLHHVCIESTGCLFEQFIETMTHDVKNSQQISLVFHYFKNAHAIIPVEFREPYREQFEKIQRLYQHHAILYQILDSNNYTQAEYDFLSQALENRKGRVSPGTISDLKTIRQFCNNKLQFAEQNNFDGDYKKSIKEFYKQAVSIRLSDLSHEDQAQQMKDAAHTEFRHRHGALRIIADIITMIGTLFSMGVGRVLTGHTFFWRTAHTTRESELNSMLQPNKDSDTVFSSILMVQA